VKQAGKYLAGLAVLSLVLAAFLIFQNLSSPAIRIWDEAIYADNALDMYTYGDPIVMKRNGELTLYNTKPPLVIWLQTLSMHAFGVNELAIRFPSALAGVLTCLMLLVFSWRTLRDLRIGIIAVLVLTTTYGFVHQHVVKTGDLDAVLVFWTTAYTLLFLHFLIRKPQRYKTLFVWIGVGAVCAFLSKSVAGLIPIAGLFICMLISRSTNCVLGHWWTWMVVGAAMAVCMGYYALREVYAPGYMYVAWYSDYTRFYTNILTWHNHPWYYYFWNWHRLEFFTPYVFWLPLAAASGLILHKHRQPMLLLTVQVLVFVGVLSYPIVKLMWYDAPVSPLLALICAIGFIVLLDAVAARLRLSESLKRMLFTAFLIIIFVIPVKTMYQRNAELYLPVDILEREGFSIRDLHRTDPKIKEYKVLMLAGQNAHYTQVDFYLNAYNRYQGYDLEILKDTSEVHTGQTVLCCQDAQAQWLDANYKVVRNLQNNIGCILVHLQEKK
jgi:4-amino-4-deoxy-L-arabinose transferase-like glycosyltransferase